MSVTRSPGRTNSVQNLVRSHKDFSIQNVDGAEKDRENALLLIPVSIEFQSGFTQTEN